ncbi:RNA 2',3'-cyclic phosphodiesterase [Shimia sp. W99]
MRAFVAIDLSDPTGAEITALQARVPVGRATPVDNLHLTLAFLGEQPVAALEELHEALADISLPEFSLKLAGLEVLGGRRAKVLCLRAFPDPALIALHDAVRSAARRVGIMPERRRFHPHVTISRFGGGLGTQEMARLGAFLEGMGDWALPECAVSHFSLFESILTSERAIHQPMATYPLVGLFNPGR